MVADRSLKLSPNYWEYLALLRKKHPTEHEHDKGDRLLNKCPYTATWPEFAMYMKSWEIQVL